MQYLFIILISIILVVVSFVGTKYNYYKLNSFISLMLLIIISGFVSYTPDMEGYNYWFENESGNDLLFNIATIFFKKLGINDFQFLHLSYIALSSLLLIVFVNRFRQNSFLVILAFLSIDFLFFTTQIRFYLGYFSMCLALYYYYFKNFKYFIVFAVFGLISHLSLILFLPFIFLINLKVKYLYQLIAIGSILFYLLSKMLLSLIINITFLNERFISYSYEEDFTTFSGALYKFFPVLLNLFVVIYMREKFYTRYPKLFEDRGLNFLFNASIIFYVLLGIAFVIQILGTRFIESTIIFQILFLLKLSDNLKSSKLIFILFLLLLFNLLYIFVLPSFILDKSSDLWDNVERILESNIVIKKLYL